MRKIKKTKRIWKTPTKWTIFGLTIAIVAIVVGSVAALNGWFGGEGKVSGDALTRGLVGYWSFDEGSGTLVADASEYANHGTLTTGATTTGWTQGKISSALSFDGSDDYVGAADSNSLDLTSAITISAWINPSGWGSDGGDGHIVSKADDASVTNGYAFYLSRADGNALKFYANGGGITLYAANSISLNQWQHVAVTYDKQTLKLFVNGILKNSLAETDAITTNSSSLLLGARISGSDHFNGSIDEVRVYNRALSAEEVRYSYNRGGPIAHWKMDEGTGSTAYNSADTPQTTTSTDCHLYLAPAGNLATSSAWVAGKHGSALEFDGTDDYLDCGNDALLNITDALTVETWVLDPPTAESEIVAVNYPEDIKTDQEKLAAIYYLLEQMRLEHNRQGELARSDWKKYENNWATYAKIFKAKQLSLLKEQGRLRNNIRAATYSKSEWDGLTEEQLGTAFIQMYGDRQQLKDIPTKATSDPLNQLRAIDLEKLTGEVVDPLEDFTTYTEVDNNNIITIDSNTVSWVGLDREIGERVYADKGVGHFAGDYEHLFTANATAYGGSGAQYALYWMLKNVATGGNASPTNLSYIYAGSAIDLRWRIYDGATGGIDEYLAGATFGTERYFTVDRTGTTLTEKIYSDAARTSLTDTLSLAGVAATAYQYVYAMSSLSGSGAYDLDGYIENLDLQEVAASRIIVGKGQDAYELQIDSNLNILAYVNNQAVTATTTKDWHHLALTYDGVMQKLYIDGILKDSALLSGSIATNSTHIKIGELVPGKIDDVRIYSYARTPEEIKLDYNAGFAARFGPQSSCGEDPGACMTNGLVGYWSMDEGSGLEIYDQSGYSNQGHLYGATTTLPWTTGVVPGSLGKAGGGSLKFDGTNDTVIVPSMKAQPVGSADRTIEFWVKPTSFANIQYLLTQGVFLESQMFAIFLRNGTGEFEMGTHTHNLDTDWNLTLDTWTHLVVTLSGGNYVSMYANGELKKVGTITATANTAETSVYIGARTDDTNWASAYIDEVKLYGRALSAEEVRYHYNRGSPVAHWKMDEGGGRTVYDSTDNDRDGTLVLAGSATSSAWVTGKYGSALSFDGTDDYVSATDGTKITDLPALTLGSWVYVNGLSAQQFLFSKGSGTAQLQFYIDTNGDFSFKRRYDGASHAQAISAAGIITTGQWYYLVGTLSNKSISLYLNGKEVSYSSRLAGAGNLVSDAGNFIIASSLGSTAFFNGVIDDVRLYNYVRTPAEIRLDYNAGLAAHFGPKTDCKSNPRACLTNGLISYWAFEEGSGNKAYDSSDNSNTATLYNMVTSTNAWVKGKIGGAVQTDGADDYITFTSSMKTQGTVESWFYWQRQASSIANYQTIFSNFLYQHPTNDFLYLEGGSMLFVVTPTLNTWNHILVTWTDSSDSATVNLYLNGALASRTQVASYALQNISGLARYSTGSQFLQAKIDEVRKYDRVLTDEEIQYHYKRSEPVAHWKMDEGEGRTVYDSTENNNDGTLVLAGSATSSAWVAGKYGGALNFDGVNDYVSVADNATLDITSALTISAWIKSDVDQNGSIRYIIGTGGDSYLLNFDHSTADFKGTIRITSGGVTYDSDGPVTITSGIWHHVVGIYDGTYLRFYLDGVEKTNRNIGRKAIAANTSLTIGAYNSSNYFIDGLVDDVRIYNYARTAEQIKQDYNAGLSAHFK